MMAVESERTGPFTASGQPIRPGDCLKARFAGQEFSIDPLTGTERQVFRREVLREVSALVGRAGNLAATWPVLDAGIDIPSLVKLGVPGIVTNELIERSSVLERHVLLLGLFWQHGLGALREAIDVNVVTKSKEFAALKSALVDEIRQEVDR